MTKLLAVLAFMAVADDCRQRDPLWWWTCYQNDSGNSNNCDISIGNDSVAPNDPSNPNNNGGGRVDAGRGNGSEGNPDQDPGRSGGRNKGGD